MKKFLLILIIFIIILIIFIRFFYKSSVNNDKNKIIDNIITNNEDFNVIENNVVNDADVILKSIDGNEIQKDGIEVSEIKLNFSNGRIDYAGYIKNITNEEKRVLYLEIEYYDRNDKIVSSALIDVNKVLMPNDTFEFESNIVGEKKYNKVVSAKITNIKFEDEYDKIR